MSFEPLIKKINAVISAVQDEKTLGDLGVEMFIELKAEYTRRIFEQGLNTASKPIGKYSTEPGYYSQGQFIRKASFKPQGKFSTGDFKNGNKRKSMFLQSGYSQFRKIQGRKTDKVNLKLSGSLERGFDILQDGDSVIFGQTSQFEALKMYGIEDKFGEVFSLAEEEIEFIGERVNEGYAVLIRDNE